jgi:hypothetical protein
MVSASAAQTVVRSISPSSRGRPLRERVGFGGEVGQHRVDRRIDLLPGDLDGFTQF